jgi:predicted GNAT family acetyltransferase
MDNEKHFNLIIDNKIIGTCIVVQENINIYEINDLLIDNEYRGKGYAGKLLNKIIDYYVEMNKTNNTNNTNKTNKEIMIKVCAEIKNVSAIKAYTKIFGNPYRYDTRYAYFYLNK